MNLKPDNKNFSNLAITAPKFNLKSLLILLLFVIGIYLLIPKLVGVQETLKLVFKVNRYYLLLAIVSEVFSYLCAAWALGIILSKLGYKIRFFDRFRLGSIAAFAIHFFPIGSFGEGAVNFYFLRQRGVAAGSILLTLVLRIIVTYSAFLSLFLIGLVLVPTAPHLPFSPKVVSGVLFLVIVWGISYMIYLYKRKEKFRAVWKKYLNFANRFLRILRRKTISDKKIDEIFEDIYEGIGIFGQKKRTSAKAILAGILYWLGDIICFYFVFLSFGYHIHFGVLLFGYGVGTLAGLISFIPGGLGVTEGSLGLVYSGLGVPFAIAFTTILVFRFFSFWIWVPVGLVSYLTLRRESNENV